MADITFSVIETNGIQMRVAEAGAGPLVLLVHGWPESWYSWRHQIRGLADSGYRVIAPDMRGYGDTSSPAAAADYRIDILVADLVGLLDTHVRRYDTVAAICQPPDLMTPGIP